jgi:hypothetical protein
VDLSNILDNASGWLELNRIKLEVLCFMFDGFRRYAHCWRIQWYA